MKKYWLICAACVLIQGCAETVQAPALHDFGVDTVQPVQSLQKSSEAEIRVVAPKWLSDNQIRYRMLYDQPSRVRFYNLDQWIAPPPELLRLHLASGRFDPDYSLVIHLLNFEQQFEAPGRASVVLRFSAEALSANRKNRSDREVFLLRSGRVSPDAQGAVKGFAELAEQARQRIQAWLLNLAKP
jgi:cholesterol transport system auxiliary component